MILKIVNAKGTSIYQSNSVNYSKVNLLACQLADPEFENIQVLEYLRNVKPEDDLDLWLFELETKKVACYRHSSKVYIMNDAGKTIEILD